jgi:hypothetical protein
LKGRPGPARNLRRLVVLNAAMSYRPLTGAAAACALVLALAAPASARIIEVGQAATEATPTCPGNPCLAISRTTGYQAKVVDSREVYVVPAPGRIVAWTVKLGSPTAKQIKFFEGNFGAASAGITVLKRGERLFSRVVARSAIRPLGDYFGQTVQFPLARALHVRKGQMIALTVPTWAPALSTLTDDGSSWRASRALDKCDDTDTQTAQQAVGALTQYRCLYKARITYSATLITKPEPNPKPKPKT